MAKRVTIRLTDELEAYANASGIPVATAIRELAVKGLRSNVNTTSVQPAPSNNYKDALLALVKIIEEETAADTSQVYQLLGEPLKKKSSQKKVSTKQTPPTESKEALVQNRAEEVENSFQKQTEMQQQPLRQEEPAKPIVEEDTSNNDGDITITEDTDAPISEDIMASLNEMLGIM